MELLAEKKLTNFAKWSILVGAVILVIQATNLLAIEYQDSEYFDNNTNIDYIEEVLRSYKRQAVNNGENCEIPLKPFFTQYTILGQSETSYRPGDLVKQHSILEISCNKGYALSPFASKKLICQGGKWDNQPTACLSTCPSLISTESTTVTCSYNKRLLKDCINPVKDTIAELSCNPLYEETNIQQNPIRACRENKQWDSFIPDCSPTCGVKHPKGVPNIINGKATSIGDYPWQVALYYSNTYEYFCSGSIIDVNIILTAAHCITDYNGTIHPASNYLVAAGKYFRKYDQDGDHLAQYSNVSAIYVPERYSGRVNMFALDIAILILSNPFTLTEAVQPVCIELNERSRYVDLSAGDEGIVTGWGHTQEGGVVSDVLKELIIPYIPHPTCFNELPRDFRRYLTHDKLCGGYRKNATSICRGDSGGALVFKGFSSDRYFVQGIVSTSPATVALTCDSNQYSLFTNVNSHIRFVRNLLATNRLRKPLICDSEDCVNEQNMELTKSENCEIPLKPLFTQYTILGQSETSYRPGDLVKPHSILEISCNKGYALSPFASKTLICKNGNWDNQPTACLSTCPSLISTESTTVQCSYNNVQLKDCINPVKETIAKLSCNPLYEETHIQQNPIRVCRKNRKWDYFIPCTPICGVKHPHGVPNIVNGKSTSIGDYPWQVALYYSRNHEFFCSGSLIDQNIILTAAHCLTDYNGTIYPASNYIVAAGKYFRKYDQDGDHLAQYSNVSAIHVPERYSGSINMFALDIAILILSNPFTLTEAVQPVCIELNEEFSNVPLSKGDEGIVTGWGHTQEGGVLSDVLKELIIPYIPHRTCFNEVPSDFRRYLTQDKFCGGYRKKETSICRGDSGGALVFKGFSNDRYFVQGIVSTSPATVALTCDSNQYSLFTKFNNHITFVRNILGNNQFHKPLECDSDDCANEQYIMELTKRKTCTLPNFPLNGKYILNENDAFYEPGDSVKSNSSLSLKCDIGFVSGSMSQSYCSDTGEWIPALMGCSSSSKFGFGKFCPSLKSTTSTNVKCKYNATLLENCENPRSGTTVLISCIGFKEEPSLQENPIRLCMNGKWSSDIPECYNIPTQGTDLSEARYKPKPDDDQNSFHHPCPSLTSNLSTNVKCMYKDKILNNCLNPLNGTKVIISCNPFYTRHSLEESSIVICKNGQWSSSIPQCHPSHSETNLLIGPHNGLHRIYCPPLISSASTNFECKHNAQPSEDCLTAVHSTTVLISCNPSYEEASLKVNPIRLCQNGEWSSTIPQCYPSNHEVPSAAYAPTLPDQTSFHRNYCSPLTSSTSTNFKCKFDAKPTMDCQNPESGTTVLISCNPSYEERSLEINPIRLCRNGQWSSTIPQCYPSNRGVFSEAYDPSRNDQTPYQRIYCPPLISSASTNFECKHNAKPSEDCLTAVHSTTVLISCNPSYEEASLKINPIRLCQNGEWSSTIPQCYPSNHEVPSAAYAPTLPDQTSFHHQPIAQGVVPVLANRLQFRQHVDNIKDYFGYLG